MTDAELKETAGYSKTLTITLAALMAALTAVCSWMTIPATVPVTLQTFAVFLTLMVLGGKTGTVSILLYICIGAAGVPVFAGFKGGLSVLVGPTGGYILGFLFCSKCFGLFCSSYRCLKRRKAFIYTAYSGRNPGLESKKIRKRA